jgi:hypothetical protein
MCNKTKIALAVALILGSASVALAGDQGEDRGGYRVQTWEDIARSAQYIQDQIKQGYHTGDAGAAHGHVKPAKPTKPAHKEPKIVR